MYFFQLSELVNRPV